MAVKTPSLHIPDNLPKPDPTSPFMLQVRDAVTYIRRQGIDREPLEMAIIIAALTQLLLEDTRLVPHG